VRVRGLRSDLVASPGAIEHVQARGAAHPSSGASWRLQSWPEAGDEYRVDARVVRPGAGELRRARAPSGARIAAYTQLGWPTPPFRRAPWVLPLWPLGLMRAARDSQPPAFPIDVPPFGDRRDPAATAALARSPYRGVAALARRLASGARTEWQVVARVIRYLREGDRFHYTTDVGPPGRFPLADFLLHTHAGYCQHFAGAAALLLRLVGVPARLVAGFATGVRRSGRFEVRDVDAHDWIEVYFKGYGWVPFNPTPAAAPAAIAPGLDLFAPTAPRGRMLGWRAWTVLGLLAAVGVAGSRLRRRPRELGDVLARLLRTPSGPSTTLGELADELARSVGAHTSALATEAERDLFASPGAAQRRWTSARIARALARDVGPWRAALLLAGAASAGARSSQRKTQNELA
jgi:transglutaminase-like putative cysteine protease